MKIRLTALRIVLGVVVLYFAVSGLLTYWPGPKHNVPVKPSPAWAHQKH
jgi:hypothetical protein